MTTVGAFERRIEDLERRIEDLEELMQNHRHTLPLGRRTQNLEYDQIMAEVEYEHG